MEYEVKEQYTDRKKKLTVTTNISSIVLSPNYEKHYYFETGIFVALVSVRKPR